MEKSFNNLSVVEQGNIWMDWIKNHLEDKNDIKYFTKFLANMAHKNYIKGRNEGYYEGYHNAKHDLEIEKEIEEILELEEIEFEE